MALLTQTDKTRIRQMREDGTPVGYIAAAMEMTVEDVEAVLARKEPPEQPKTRTEKKYRTEPISDEVKAEVISMVESGATIAEIKAKTGVSQASISRIKAAMKEKEPAAAATATDSREITVRVNDSTKTAESQALRGVNVLGVLECALSDAYGTDAEIMSLRADSEQAHIMFRYGGEAYALSFGLVL